MSHPALGPGKIAVVTGAADGIGAATVRAFVAEGAAGVVVADRSVEAGEAVTADLRERGADAVFVRTDVGIRSDVESMIDAALERWDRVDVLVNNAWGGGTLARVEHKTTESVERAFAVGFEGPLWAMQRAFRSMRAQGWGRVINLCSLNGVNAHIGTLEYNATKEALRTLTRTAAREWASYGIVVNAVCPGAKTGASRAVFAAHPELERAADATNPMGRLGDPDDDIAPVLCFLASDACRYLTGNTLFVDGGSHINGVSWAPELPDSPV
jgi:NAD(P)-dependent dehydrogenase (short-subunit alcohol dehydrogenase family)